MEKNILLCFVLVVFHFTGLRAQQTLPKNEQLNFQLYRGGPAVTLESWGKEDLEIDNPLCNETWTDGGLSGSAGNLVAVYDLTTPDTCSNVTFTPRNLTSSLDVVGLYWTIPTFRSAAAITATALCQFNLLETVKIYRGRFYEDGLENVWHTPLLCTTDTLITHTISIVEPINFTSTPVNICSNSSRLDLNELVNNVSGTFSGNGVEDAHYFNPAEVAPGAYQVKYSRVYDNGSVTDSLLVTVHPAPVVTAGSDLNVCQNAPNLAITGGTPAGGTWTGDFVESNQFVPADAEGGENTVVYTYTDANNCSGTDSKIILVNIPPTVTAGSDVEVCQNAPAFELQGGLPTGGVWSGESVTSISFNPATAEEGKNNVTYTFTDENNCSSSDIKVVTVNLAPVVDAGDPVSTCSNNEDFLLTGATPAGGTWSGEFVTSNQFTPSKATAGNNNATYTYTNDKNCTASDVKIVVVYIPPTVTAGDDISTCQNSPELTLSGASPSGGTWSGAFVSSGKFSPSEAKAGENIVTYSYSDTNNCSKTDQKIIVVNTPPVVSSGTDFSICENSPDLLLTGGIPANGTWSGSGVTDGRFFPSQAEGGVNIIKYRYTDPITTCSNESNISVTVNDAPDLKINGDSTICFNDGNLVLTATPAGGTWTGKGISGNVFNPTQADLGINALTYTFSNSSQCTSTSTTSVTVNPAPEVSAGLPLSVCSNEASFSLEGGTPTGGSWSGAGTSGINFNPASAAIGENSLSYKFTNTVNGCSNTAIKVVTVRRATEINPGKDDVLCLNSGSYLLGATPTGGSWAGKGVSGTTFNPQIAGTGAHVLSYSLTNAENCLSAADITLKVNPLPSIDAGENLSLCNNGTSVKLNASPAGGRWTSTSLALTGNTYDPKKESQKEVELSYAYTDSNNCSNYATIEITILEKPQVTVAQSNNGCINQKSITLTGGTPSGGKWVGKDIDEDMLEIAGYGLGRHTVRYIFTDENSCSDTASAAVNIFGIPSVEAGDDSAICYSNPPVELTSFAKSNPLTGTWTGPGVSNNVLDPSLAVLGSNTFFYAVTDTNNCTNTDSITIILNPVPPTPVVSGKLSYCFGETVLLSVPESEYKIQWLDKDSKFNLGNTANFEKIADTTMNLQAIYINDELCGSFPADVVVNVDNPFGTIAADQDTAGFSDKVSFRFIGSSNNNFAWSFTNGSKSVEQNPGMYFYKEGNIGYTLEVESPFGCKQSYNDDEAVYVKPYESKAISSDNGTHMEKEYAKEKLVIYPNPFQEKINVRNLNGGISGTYKIVNTTGTTLLQGKTEEIISMENIPQGIYILILENEGHLYKYQLEKL